MQEGEFHSASCFMALMVSLSPAMCSFGTERSARKASENKIRTKIRKIMSMELSFYPLMWLEAERARVSDLIQIQIHFPPTHHVHPCPSLLRTYHRYPAFSPPPLMSRIGQRFPVFRIPPSLVAQLYQGWINFCLIYQDFLHSPTLSRRLIFSRFLGAVATF